MGFGKQRPGKPEYSLIPEVQMVIATCWKENPKERMKPLNLLVILNGSETVRVKEEEDKEDKVTKEEELKGEDEECEEITKVKRMVGLTQASIQAVEHVTGLECDEHEL